MAGALQGLGSWERGLGGAAYLSDHSGPGLLDFGSRRSARSRAVGRTALNIPIIGDLHDGRMRTMAEIVRGPTDQKAPELTALPWWGTGGFVNFYGSRF
jgi:hypothetical protein